MTFSRRHIDLEFQLGSGDFGETKTAGNTATLTGLRVACTVNRAGGVTPTNLQLRVYGVDLNVMNQVSTLGKLISTDKRINTVTVRAWSDDNPAKSVIAIATIQNAWIDMSAPPAGFLIVDGASALVEATKPVPPTSVNGSADAATMVQSLAAQMGWSFLNYGVTTQISNPYYPGTAKDQIQNIARAGPFNVLFDPVNGVNTVTIFPMGGKVDGTIPLISKDTGMVGYPAHTDSGISVTTIFNPLIAFGALVEIKSDIVRANGQWQPYNITHDLESETPGGKWFTHMDCNKFGTITPIA